jgi:hypothetical protein
VQTHGEVEVEFDPSFATLCATISVVGTLNNFAIGGNVSHNVALYVQTLHQQQNHLKLN